MRWIVPVLATVLAASACGGPKIPAHNGYKSEKAQPWKKPKTLSWNEKLEARADDDLSYPEKNRARWYAVDLASGGDLTARLEVTPPGDAVNEDFDLGFEILDSGFRSLTKSDLDDEDAGETTKSKSLLGLDAGRYYIHLYLQSRLDTCDYGLRLNYKPTSAQTMQSSFPEQVAYLDPLPVVPNSDDAPPGYKKPVASTTKVEHRPHGPSKPNTPTQPATPAISITGRIVGVSVSGASSVITIAKGTDAGAADGMKAHVKGVSGTGELSGCSARMCKATISATPDQIKASGGSVTITP